MAIRTELTLRLPNSPGALAGVCRALAAERVNIVALSVEPTGQLRLVVDNHVRASGVLRERHHQVTTREVLVAAVGSGPGALAPILDMVAGVGVNVGTGVEVAGGTEVAVEVAGGGVVPPLSAAAALIRPQAQLVPVPLIGSAVVRIRSTTDWAVAPVFCDQIRPARAATCGEAIDVPLNES